MNATCMYIFLLKHECHNDQQSFLLLLKCYFEKMLKFWSPIALRCQILFNFSFLAECWHLPEDFASLDLKFWNQVGSTNLSPKFMSRVTKKTHPTYGSAPPKMLKIVQNCGQPIYCLKQDVCDFEGLHVILPTRKSSRLRCNEFHSLWRCVWFLSWKWMIQSTWTRISLRETLQWRLMGLFNACDKFLLLRASQPKKRICYRHDHQLLEKHSFLILLLSTVWHQRTWKKTWGNLHLPNFTTKIWIPEIPEALWPWKLLLRPSQTQQAGSFLIAYSFSDPNSTKQTHLGNVSI